MIRHWYGFNHFITNVFIAADDWNLRTSIGVETEFHDMYHIRKSYFIKERNEDEKIHEQTTVKTELTRTVCRQINIYARSGGKSPFYCPGSANKTLTTPQRHLGNAHHYPHVGKCPLPLHVLAVQYAPLWNYYRMLVKRYGSITGRHRIVIKCYGSLGYRYGTLQNVTEALQITTRGFGTLWHRYGKYRFCQSIKF